MKLARRRAAQGQVISPPQQKSKLEAGAPLEASEVDDAYQEYKRLGVVVGASMASARDASLAAELARSEEDSMFLANSEHVATVLRLLSSRVLAFRPGAVEPSEPSTVAPVLSDPSR